MADSLDVMRAHRLAKSESQLDEAMKRAVHWERLHDNRTRELNELHSKIADIARRIGPARLPESIRKELEGLATRESKTKIDTADSAH